MEDLTIKRIHEILVEKGFKKIRFEQGKSFSAVLQIEYKARHFCEIDNFQYVTLIHGSKYKAHKIKLPNPIKCEIGIFALVFILNVGNDSEE